MNINQIQITIIISVMTISLLFMIIYFIIDSTVKGNNTKEEVVNNNQGPLVKDPSIHKGNDVDE